MIQHAIAAALLLTQAATPAPAQRCLTRDQAGNLAVVGAAIFVRGARDLCRDQLPSGAYLLSPAAERYDAALRTEAERRLDSAAAGIDRLFAFGDSAPAVFGLMLRGLMTAGPPAEVASMADAPNCADLSLMIEAMSAVPPEGVAQFASAAAAMGSRIHDREQRRAAERLAAAAEESGPDPQAEGPSPRARPPAGPVICPT